MTGFRRWSRSPFQREPRRVPGCGPMPCKCMFIGERPGWEEATHRPEPKPFVGPSGRILDVCLQAAAIDRDECYLTNLVKTYSDYKKPTAQDIADDHDELVNEIICCEPEIIVLVGAYAVSGVLAKEGKSDIDHIHGVPFTVHELFGGGLQGEYVVFPMLHPANAIYASEQLSNILDDCLTLGKLIDGEVEPMPPDEYQGREDYRALAGDRVYWWLHEREGAREVAIDTEAVAGKPWSVQVSVKPGEAMFVLASDKEGLSHLRQWLRTLKPKVILHNSLFDLTPLAAMGIEFDDGQVEDTMIEAYHLCVEPQSLKSLAYRHLRAERKTYDEMVSPAREQKSLAYLSRITELDGHWPLPEPEVIWEAGKSRVYKPQSIVKRTQKILNDWVEYQVGEREKEVDLVDRWRKIDARLRKPVMSELGDMPAADLSDINFDDAVHYAAGDASDTLRIAPPLRAKIKAMEVESALQVDHDIVPMVNRMQETGIRLAGPKFWQDIITQCERQMSRSQHELYVATGRDINPASGDQVAELLYGSKAEGGLGLKPPQMTESGDRGSVNAVCLESLLSESPIVQHVMDYTEAQKIKGTYAEPLLELCELGDRRVRSTIRLTRTKTGRLSMADPPLHQIPIMTDLGREIRGGFIAEDGHVLGDWDVSHLEMRMCAHDSRDDELCRLFIQDRDIHTETACKIFSIAMNDLKRDPETGEVKDVRRTVAKHAAFGIINGITEHGFVNYMILNRCKRPDGQPWTLDDCLMLIKGWFEIYKGVKRFQDACVEETRRTGLARETISGRIVYLPQVWSPNKVVRESAERMSYVQHTQSGGAAVVKKSMAVMWRELFKLRPDIKPLLQVHDEIVAEMPDDEDTKKQADRIMQHAFTDTVKLRVPLKCSGGFGKDWLSAH